MQQLILECKWVIEIGPDVSLFKNFAVIHSYQQVQAPSGGNMNYTVKPYIHCNKNQGKKSLLEARAKAGVSLDPSWWPSSHIIGAQ